MSESLPNGFQTDPAETALLTRSIQRHFLYPILVGSSLDSMCLGILLILLSLWGWETTTGAQHANNRANASRRTGFGHHYAHAIKHRTQDGPWTKALIVFLAVIALISSCLMLVQVWKWLVDGFDNSMLLTNITFFRLFPALCAISRVPASIFFAIRAWRLHDKSVYVPLFLVPTLQVLRPSSMSLRLLCLAGGITASILLDPIPGNLERTSNYMLITPASEVVADLFITLALFTGLRKRRTGWRRTDELLRRVVNVTLETQLPPVIVAVAFLLTTAAIQNGLTSAYFVFWPKIHAICFMLVILTRRDLLSKSRRNCDLQDSGAMPAPELDVNADTAGDDNAAHGSTVELVDGRLEIYYNRDDKR